jgi:hypothetical protein
MVVMRMGAVWLSVAVAMAGCGESRSDTSPDSGTARAGRESVVMVGGEVLVSCGNIRPAFAVSAMDDGVSGLADEAEVAAALDGLRARFGIDAPRALQRRSAAEAEWKVLGGDPVDDPQRLLVGVGHWAAATGTTDGQYVVLERTANGWQPSGWGDCNLAPVLGEGASWAEIAAVSGGADPGSSTVEVLVSERECTSARDPSPYLREPVVIERDDTVTLYWTSDTPTGDQTCPGNPRVRRSVKLDRPLGTRAILDGSTWPPRPIIGF